MLAPAAARRDRGYDAVLTPTLAQPAGPVGWFDDDGDPAADFERQKRFTPYTAMYNMTGQPAVTCRCTGPTSGLPIGVMLVGRPGDEATLVSLSAQLEAPARGHRHPALW